MVDGEAVPEGARNSTLFFKALSLKDEGKSPEEVLDALRAVTRKGALHPWTPARRKGSPGARADTRCAQAAPSRGP
jgi:hypothetical protein